jgi:GDPmannose 4,6-dehydratase
MKSALITGAAGQDGILLSQMLVADGYRVVGMIKPGMSGAGLHAYAPPVDVIDCDLADSDGLRDLIARTHPDEIYNLGGVSSIVESVNHPEMTHRVNVGAVEVILDAMTSLAPSCRFVQAASGTIFEGSEIEPQTETTPRSPRTPYAMAKAETLDLIADARARHGLHASAAILYNHESPLRGSGFVTRRITEGAARIAAGLQETLELGNIDVCRDWGWAPDYVRGMRAMMAADEPDDYILATGTTHWLREFLELAFVAVGIDDWHDRVVTREDLRRTTDPVVLRGDSTKAHTRLGWQHTRTFAQIAQEMVAYDIRLVVDPQALWHES